MAKKNNFLVIAPYIKRNTRLTTDVPTSTGLIKKGAVVNDVAYTRLGKTRMKLNVIDTPQIKREYERKKVKTYKDGNRSKYVYYNSGDAGVTVTCKIIVKKDDIVRGGGKRDKKGYNKNDHRVWSYLQYFYVNNIMVSVYADSLIIPNGVYVISDFTEYDNVRRDVFEAEIELTSHALKSSKTVKKVTPLQRNLAKCKKPSTKLATNTSIKNGKSKPSKCITYINQVLKGVGLLSVANYKKYGNYWTNASKKGLVLYQKGWNKKGLSPRLQTKGILDNKTWAALKRYPELKATPNKKR